MVWTLSSTALLTLLLAPFPRARPELRRPATGLGHGAGVSGSCSARLCAASGAGSPRRSGCSSWGRARWLRPSCGSSSSSPTSTPRSAAGSRVARSCTARAPRGHRGRRSSRDCVQRAQRGAARGASARLPREPRQAHDRPADARHVRHGHASDAHRRPAAARLQHLGHLADDRRAQAGLRPGRRAGRPRDHASALPARRARDPARFRPADLLPPDPRRRAGAAVPDAQVPHDGARRRGEAPGARSASTSSQTRCSSSRPTRA